MRKFVVCVAAINAIFVTLSCNKTFYLELKILSNKENKLFIFRDQKLNKKGLAGKDIKSLN